MNRSTRLSFEKLINTRDLGGMKTSDGRVIRSGCLIRCEKLFDASENDLKKLQEMGLRKVIDFRTDAEVSQCPHPQMEGVEYIRIPVLEDLKLGVTREEEAMNLTMQMLLREGRNDPERGFNFMRDAYVDFVSVEYTMKQYARFIEELMKTEEGITAWHCTLGKDRCGFGSVIIETVLGVDRDGVRDDFLMTNECVEKTNAKIIASVQDQIALYPCLEKVFRDALGVNDGYLDAAYEKCDELYGGFENYLLEKLGITDEVRERLREMYLL